MNRFLLTIFVSSLFLTACGGGGGGGGGSNGSSDSDSDNNVPLDTVEEQLFEQSQNSYLPFIQGAGWRFSGSVAMTANAEANNEYSITNDLGEFGQLVQYFTSTPSQITLEELRGPATFDLGGTNVTINSIVFNEPVIIRSATSLPLSFDTISATVSASAGGFTLGGLAFTANITVGTESVETTVSDWAGYPAYQSNVTIQLTGNVLGVGDIDVTINEVSQFVEGIGFISRTLSFPDLGVPAFDLEIEELVNLPSPIVFLVDDVTPVAVTNTTIRIEGETVSPEEYEILNDSELDALDWVTVAANVDSSAYIVEMLPSENLPEEATVVVIYLSNDDGETQLPVNVTLMVD
ncbi:MAG: hypothetical protein MI976_10565 [Pseudomonadales bacterium]|nr:hypothetical protein [Pseudomonadales bacterium]